MTRRANGRSSGQRGASLVEYAGLIVLAALILGSLVALGIPGKISSGVGSAICRIFDQGNCGKQQPSASGRSPNGPAGTRPAQPSQSAPAPRPTDPLQVRLASFNAAAGKPQPNPQPQQPPPQNPGGTQTPWGRSTGHGPGNPGIGRQGDLPSEGPHAYEPPKSGHGKPVPIKGRNAWRDKYGRTWQWDKQHEDHWDVTDPKTGKHINVNPDGNEARKPQATTSPKPTPPPPPPPGKKGKRGGKSHFSWEPWAAGAGAAGIGTVIWWGLKVLSPACGPALPACALVF